MCIALLVSTTLQAAYLGWQVRRQMPGALRPWVVAVTVSAVAHIDLEADSVDGYVQSDARTFDAVSLASLPGTRSSHISLQSKYSFRGLNP